MSVAPTIDCSIRPSLIKRLSDIELKKLGVYTPVCLPFRISQVGKLMHRMENSVKVLGTMVKPIQT
jgi:hypothetical protein